MDPVDVGELFAFILDLSQYGFNIRRTFQREKRSSSKKIAASVLNTENSAQP